MPLPAEAREGFSGLVGDTCACQLDGDDDDRRLPYCLDYDDEELLHRQQPRACHIATGTPGTFRYTPLVDRRTQYHPLSAAVNKHSGIALASGVLAPIVTC